jgi:hypothetical protein
MTAALEKTLKVWRYTAASIGALCIFGYVAPTACAQPKAGKVGLVIASSSAGVEGMSGCSATGRDVAAVLENTGYDVVTLIDGTSIAMRGTIQIFKGKLEGGGKLAFAYLCGPAAAVGERIFLLPHEIDPGKVHRLETQGIVVPAIMNAMTDAEGTLLGDLSGVDDDGARKALGQRADGAGIQTILAVRKERGEPVGQAFVTKFPQSGTEGLAAPAVVQALVKSGLASTILFVSPEKLPPAVQADEEDGPDIAIVPVPLARPIAASSLADVPVAKPTKVTARKKVRAPRVKQPAKPKGLFDFLKSNRRIRE